MKQRADVLNDRNGWYRQQQRNGAWTDDQKAQMNSWARYIKTGRDNPNATLEQQQRGLRFADMLVKTYGTKPNFDKQMPQLKARYGADVRINPQTGGLEITSTRNVYMPFHNPEVAPEVRDYWASQVPRDVKRMLGLGRSHESMSDEQYNQAVQDFQRHLTVESNGEYGVLDRNEIELFPGVSIRPRMIKGKNGKMMVAPADQRVINWARKRRVYR